MRTNTWLGLIAIGQSAQYLTSLQQQNAQAARDRERDRTFQAAAEAAQRGQFAMWIQTPDGERFERWKTHALDASRSIDDREVAWVAAWRVHYEKRQREVPVEAERFSLEQVPQSDGEPQPQEERVAPPGFAFRSSLGIAMVGLLILWLVFLGGAQLSFFSITIPVSRIFILLAALALVGILASLYRVNAKMDPMVAKGRAERAEQERKRSRERTERERLRKQYIYENMPTNVDPPFYWHAVLDREKLASLDRQVMSIVEDAQVKYPRQGDLLDLGRIYMTVEFYPKHEELPDSIQNLLKAFRKDDVGKVGELSREGLIERVRVLRLIAASMRTFIHTTY